VRYVGASVTLGSTLLVKSSYTESSVKGWALPLQPHPRQGLPEAHIRIPQYQPVSINSVLLAESGTSFVLPNMKSTKVGLLKARSPGASKKSKITNLGIGGQNMIAGKILNTRM
jgi:hypothetical protein